MDMITVVRRNQECFNSVGKLIFKEYHRYKYYYMRQKILVRFLVVILAGIAAAAIIESCNKLDLTPLDKTTTATFFTKKADFDGALFAAYSSMQDMWEVNSA